MFEISEDMKKKILDAASQEEIKAILEDSGAEASADEIARMYREVMSRQTGEKELSMEELEAISGGQDRDWVRDGCAATCEMDSSCWGTDYCQGWSVTYDNFGWYLLDCPKGGKHDFGIYSETYNNTRATYTPVFGTCKKCGFTCDGGSNRKF